ncbi:hypothetical protein BGY98DRAFT_940571, partial [Russula aff. rugulosa BPL654]
MFVARKAWGVNTLMGRPPVHPRSVPAVPPTEDRRVAAQVQVEGGKQSKEEVGAGQGCGHVVHSEVGAVAEESLEAGWPWLSGDRVTEDSGHQIELETLEKWRKEPGAVIEDGLQFEGIAFLFDAIGCPSQSLLISLQTAQDASWPLRKGRAPRKAKGCHSGVIMLLNVAN